MALGLDLMELKCIESKENLCKLFLIENLSILSMYCGAVSPYLVWPQSSLHWQPLSPVLTLYLSLVTPPASGPTSAQPRPT